jgi:hypothetical protein
MAKKELDIEKQAPWSDAIPDEQWQVYQKVITEARRRNIEFSLGGAFAVATYTGRWRNTKDLDFYVLPEKREEMVASIYEAGLQDYFDVLPYDRNWIFRGYEGENIVDAIWAMPNQRTEVDASWVTDGPEVTIRGETFRIVPPEEMIWGKIYVLQKERCDWPDVFNMIHSHGPELDWAHLINRLGDDIPLLRGVLSVFSWLSPKRSWELPDWLFESLHLPRPERPSTHEVMLNHARRLDTRDWFGPLMGD